MALNKIITQAIKKTITQTITKTIRWFKSELNAIKRLKQDDLDLINAGQWPNLIKILSLLLLISSLVFASHWLLLNYYQETLISTQKEQQNLLAHYQQRSFQAANLTAYQQQMQQIEATFTHLLAFLPSENEIPHLLDNLQQAATQQHLEILAVNLKQPQVENFYTQLPLEIKVQGSFHHLAHFMAGISRLDRIVTLHNFNLMPAKTGANSLNSLAANQLLTLEIEARTYRYNPPITKAERNQ